MPTTRGTSSLARSVLQLVAGRRRRFRIEGASMEPTFVDGQTVLIDPGAYRERSPEIGDVVLSRHPLRSDVTIVKRVCGVLDDGALDLRGDNARSSTDSRSFGGVRCALVIGRVERPFP